MVACFHIVLIVVRNCHKAHQDVVVAGKLVVDVAVDALHKRYCGHHHVELTVVEDEVGVPCHSLVGVEVDVESHIVDEDTDKNMILVEERGNVGLVPSVGAVVVVALAEHVLPT